MLIDKLKQWQYYYTKLPLYIRNSYGIKEHFKMIFDCMIEIDNNEVEVCNVFNVLQKDYLTNVVSKYDDINGYNFSVLDMIAAIYGINRALNVTYIDNTNEVVNKALYLTNKELYMLIKTRIIQNNYDGTYKQAREYYDNIGLPFYMFTETDKNLSATCYLYLGLNDEVTDNIRALFLANLLTLKSVGIRYVLNEIDIQYIAIWSEANSTLNENNQFDVSKWS